MREQMIIAEALHAYGPVSWSLTTTRALAAMVADYIGDDNRDADSVAHALWAMGARIEHHGCPYGGPEPDDADYENNCPLCRAFLTTIGQKVVDALAAVQEPADPRVVGGRYYSGYWRKEYTVVASNGRDVPTLTLRWEDGHETQSLTQWDPQRDRVVAEPGAVI